METKAGNVLETKAGNDMKIVGNVGLLVNTAFKYIHKNLETTKKTFAGNETETKPETIKKRFYNPK